VKESFVRIYEAVEQAAQRSGRRGADITVVMVTKTQSVDTILQASQICSELGMPYIIGENYVQEYKQKYEALASQGALPQQAHCIGHLQRNKTRDAIRLFDCIETVDSSALLAELEHEAVKRDKKVSLLFQVNIDSDAGKSGISRERVSELVAAYSALQSKHLSWQGLMTIPALHEDPAASRKAFIKLRELRDELLRAEDVAKHFQTSPFHLSMGMSADYVSAIEEGATIVRIGSGLFGERPLNL
jgi:pyridoxal phosphate enzyme (YggS family)